jgi:hypothetical protein
MHIYVPVSLTFIEYHSSLNLTPQKRLIFKYSSHRSSVLYGGRGDPDQTAVRTNEGKLYGINNIHKIIVLCQSILLKAKILYVTVDDDYDVDDNDKVP